MEPTANLCFPPRFFDHALLLLQCKAIQKSKQKQNTFAHTKTSHQKPNPHQTWTHLQRNKRRILKNSNPKGHSGQHQGMQMYSLTAEGVVESPAPSQPSSLANTISREAEGLSSRALLPSPAVTPQALLPWARAPALSKQEIPPRQQCLTHPYTDTLQCHQQAAFAVQKSTGPYRQREV